MSESIEISGKIVDVVARRIFQGIVKVQNGIIQEIVECETGTDLYIVPGLIDAHIHIESSMLIPSEFARLAVIHGTVATVSDPHEMGNVMGIEGVKFMIDSGKRVPFHFFFGAPSCVPATPFETSGGSIGVEELEELLKSEDIYGLAEMMNVPGVLFHDPIVKAKLQLAVKYGKPIDGHAPGLMGKDAVTYISSGISTDHECFTLEEAVWKIQHGMKVLIREGSAARNFDDLMPLIGMHPEMVMFCSDDKHPNDLVKGHINNLVKRAIAKGYDTIEVIRCCTLNPILHYNLKVGMLQVGDPADFIVVDDLKRFNVCQTYIQGIKVAENGITLLPQHGEKPLNRFQATVLSEDDIRVYCGVGRLRVIKVIEGQLVTEEIFAEGKQVDDKLIGNPENDVLKLVVKDRYTDQPPTTAFIQGFGLRYGTIASSIAHDSHNIIAVGVDDRSITDAINLIIRSKGGISLVANDEQMILPLPFGGIMSGEDGFSVAARYEQFDAMAKSMGTRLSAPFMTLSFMALLVIPRLKLSDKGLFDGQRFQFTELFQE